jgi:hypothetical protein
VHASWVTATARVRPVALHCRECVRWVPGWWWLLNQLRRECGANWRGGLHFPLTWIWRAQLTSARPNNEIPPSILFHSLLCFFFKNKLTDDKYSRMNMCYGLFWIMAPAMAPTWADVLRIMFWIMSCCKPWGPTPLCLDALLYCLGRLIVRLETLASHGDFDLNFLFVLSSRITKTLGSFFPLWCAGSVWQQ